MQTYHTHKDTYTVYFLVYMRPVSVYFVVYEQSFVYLQVY